MKTTLMLLAAISLATAGCDYTGLQQQARYNVGSNWRSLFGKEKIEFRASFYVSAI
jgi:hypothetical protein